MTENRCQADKERRERAFRDCSMSEQVGDFERRISFEVGYDHRDFADECGGGGHGQHGMTLRFFWIGPAGATQFVCNLTSWVPGAARQGHIVGKDYSGMAMDLGYHSRVPQYDGQYAMKCDLLPEGECFYDGSGLNAERVFDDFLAHGPHAVWATLARYYTETFGGGSDE